MEVAETLSECETQILKSKIMLNKKTFLLSIYWALSLFALCGEPTSEKSMKYYIIYYAIALTNLAVTTIILKRVSDNSKNANTTATN